MCWVGSRPNSQPSDESSPLVAMSERQLVDLIGPPDEDKAYTGFRSLGYRISLPDEAGVSRMQIRIVNGMATALELVEMVYH